MSKTFYACTTRLGALILSTCVFVVALETSLCCGQEPPPHPDSFSSAEPKSVAQDFLSEPEGDLVAAAEPASERDPLAEPEAPSPADDPFADLFLELPSDRSERVLTPDELELSPSDEPQPEAVFLPAKKALQKAPQFPAFTTEQGCAVLLAAPVHEGLLTRSEVPLQSAQATVVAIPPPPEVNEQPPLPTANVPKFVGNDVQWIGGYWTWLADAGKFVWVSGVYRDVPPGRMWQPGSWTQTPHGYRWDSGYWAESRPAAKATANNASRRVSAPPPAREPGPHSPPPNDASFWIPGVWLVEDAGNQQNTTPAEGAEVADGYRWQPGFWTPRQEKWVWHPAHYVRVADTCVYVSGYWDYEPHFRGQAYAAVDFGDAAHSNSPLAYQPIYPQSRPVSTLLHLFVKPGCRNYFYGDFYDSGYAELGYQPWYSVEAGSISALSDSPLLSFYDWKYRRAGIDFASSMSRFAQHFGSAPSIRPAAQLAATRGLAYREGLAGEVYAHTFDAIVRGVVAGRSAIGLADGREHSVAKPSSAAVQIPNEAAVTTASAIQTGGQHGLPRGAAPLGLPGTSGLMVLPGGRVISASASSLPVGPAAAPATLDAPAPVPSSDFDSLFRD